MLVRTCHESVVVPDARKNLLAEINRAESTVLPAPLPPQQETLAVFLRIKPKSAQETEMVRGQEAEEKEVETVKIENEHQVALIAPPSSQTYKNSINGSGKITTRFVFEVIIHFPDTNFLQVLLFESIEARNKPARNFHGACLSQD